MLDLKVLRFAVIICLGCSLVVSAAAIGLRDRQQANLELDIQKNILKSVGLFDPLQTREQVQQTFEDHMTGFVISTDGSIVEGRAATDVNPEAEPDLLPLFRASQDGEITVIKHADTHMFTVLFGLYYKRTTIVYGD